MSEIKIVLTKDILESWKILSGAFEHPAPMLDEMYPNRDTPEGDKRIAERLDRKLNKGIGMVSVDAMIDGQLAGVAVWQFMDELPPTDIKKWESDWANTWTDDDERQYLQEMWRGFIKSRYDEVEKALKEGTKVLRTFSEYHRVQYAVSFQADMNSARISRSQPRFPSARCRGEAGSLGYQPSRRT